MDIISRIHKELDYVVFDETITNTVYQNWLKTEEIFKCLSIGHNYIAIYESKNCMVWNSCYSISFNNFTALRYMRDMAALSLCLENTFLEILGSENFSNFLTNNNFNGVCMYISIDEGSRPFDRFLDVKYSCLLKLFINMELDIKESIESIEQFFESTAFDIIWL